MYEKKKLPEGQLIDLLNDVFEFEFFPLLRGHEFLKTFVDECVEVSVFVAHSDCVDFASLNYANHLECVVALDVGLDVYIVEDDTLNKSLLECRCLSPPERVWPLSPT